ncbi:hypothetical protein TEA_003366 [Camellia sinensis var. sinensis]|uniref:Uncharacterized protein n=1 Tax=Camellia sinensis var. sinensis TaxID=542762 RepID=A0A4S4DC59_CAMSN|nr:hypothetical protein TEA_003366 [Camellia sinensis var. sinensis]
MLNFVMFDEFLEYKAGDTFLKHLDRCCFSLAVYFIGESLRHHFHHCMVEIAHGTVLLKEERETVKQILVLSGFSSGIIMLMVLNDEEFDVVLVMVLKTLVCTFYQKGVCSYGSRCRYEHVKVSRSQSSTASSSTISHQFLVSDSTAVTCSSRTASGGLTTVPGLTSELSASSRPFFPPAKVSWNQTSGHRSLLDIDDVDDSKSLDPADLSICSFAAAGCCPRGDKCPHIHGHLCPSCGKHCLHPFRPQEREEHIKTCEKKQNHLEALKHSQDIECSVCLERVLSKPTAAERKFGVLSECDHPFCISCIRNWRSSSPTSGMDVNSTLRACPICRKVSYFVIPSVIWYSTKEEKQEIVDSYKAKLSQLDFPTRLSASRIIVINHDSSALPSADGLLIASTLTLETELVHLGLVVFTRLDGRGLRQLYPQASVMDTMFVVFQHTVKPGSYLWNSTLMTDVYSSSFPDMDAIEFSSHSFDNVGIDGIHILFEHLYKSHYPLEVEELECDEDLENEVHAYRDGRLEEVVLRHLGAEDGHTVIAKNIRFCLLPCILPSFHLLATTFVVISFLFVSLSRFDAYFQALGLPQKFAHKVNACFELPGIVYQGVVKGAPRRKAQRGTAVATEGTQGEAR